MTIKRILICILILNIPIAVFSQKQKKAVATPQEGLLYFSLTAQSNGKTVTIVKDNGKSVDKDSLKMAEKITAIYKVGQKSANVKDILYDNYFLSDSIEPTILQDLHGTSFDKSIWMSCIDSLRNKEQVVFQIREITLDDGSTIQNPKLAKEFKATYRILTNPNFPAGGWKAKADHWIAMWKDWFRLTGTAFYKFDDKALELYASGVVFMVKEKPLQKDKAKH